MTRKVPDHPNVVVFFTDQQRWDTTGVHGNPLGLTPHFDRVAAEGTHANLMFTCQPVCGPARASLQTGRYALDTGVWRNGLALRPDERTLAHAFNEAGYTTGYIGKWHLADEQAVPPDQQGGYDYWLASNILEFTSEPYDTTMYDKDQQPVKLPGYRVDAQTDAAIRYIDAHQDEPFFLFLSYLEPHHQNRIDDFVPPDGYREPYQNRWIPPDLAALGGSTQQHIAGYYGIVKRLDEAFGRILDVLKSLRLDEKTIVLFTSDHGNHFKTRNSEYKRSCHESAIRLPTALIGPGFNGGGRINELVSLVDLPPTLLDAAGITVPASMQGRSILPLVNRTAVDWPQEVFLQISESQVGRAIRTQRWKYSVSAPHKNGWDDPQSDHYVEDYLYDLQADPYELHNLIAYDCYDEVKTALRERLLQRMTEAGEPRPTIAPAETHTSGQRHVLLEEMPD
jgi:arylsulfatase A-like enzyme